VSGAIGSVLCANGYSVMPSPRALSADENISTCRANATHRGIRVARDDAAQRPSLSAFGDGRANVAPGR
jgi:hypothetical protein